MRTYSMLILLLVLVAPRLATAQVDWDEYGPLYERTRATIADLDAAGDEAGQDLLERAVEHYTELLDWIAVAANTDEFRSFPEANQGELFAVRDRVQYLRAVVQLELGMCDSARQDIAVLRARPDLDPAVEQLYADALSDLNHCRPPTQTATLQVECEPGDAQIFVDGEMLGTAGTPVEIELGERRVIVRADGFSDHETTITAESAGQTVLLGPIALAAVVEPEPVGPTQSDDEQLSETPSGPENEDTSEHPSLRDTVEPVSDRPSALPWVFIGVGIALAGGGLVYDLLGSETFDELDAIRRECEIWCSSERRAEGEALADDVSTGRIVDGLLYGGAVAAVTVGIVLLLTGGSDDEPTVGVTPSLGSNRLGASFSLEF